MPSARVRTATAVKPGDLRSIRAAKRRSCQHVSTKDSQPPERTISLLTSRLPRSKRTARRASWRLMPCFIFSSVAISRYSPSSSSNSRFTCSFRNSDRSPVTMFRRNAISFHSYENSCLSRRKQSIGAWVHFHPSLWLSESHELLVTQGHYGVDTRRTARGDVARHERNTAKHKAHGSERQGIGGLYAEEQSCQKPSQADRSQCKRQSGKQREKQHVKPLLCDGRAQYILHGSEIIRRLLSRNTLQALLYSLSEQTWVAGGAYDPDQRHGLINEFRKAILHLSRRDKECRRCGPSHTKFLGIAHDADDFAHAISQPHGLSTSSNCNVLPEWILTGEKALRDRLVDKQHGRSRGIVPVCEAPSSQNGDTHHLQVMRSDCAPLGASAGIASRWVFLNREIHICARLKRQIRDRRGGLDSW